MNDVPTYAEALNPDTFRVLGKRLDHFSRGHLLLLKRLESPLITGERDVTIGDLTIAVLVCSHDYDRSRRYAYGRFTLLELAWIGGCALFVRGTHFDNAVVTFVNYLKYHQRRVSYWVKDKATRESSTPPELLYFRALRHHWGCSQTEVLKLGLLESHFMYLGWLEHEGAIQFSDEKENAKIDEINAAILKEQEAASGC